jgi:hypothetical protein
MATCKVRFLFSAENREFAFDDAVPSQTIRTIKQQVVDRWPTDLPATTKPPDATHVRLLFSGAFLEDEKRLQDVPYVSLADTTTFHVIVRAPSAEMAASPPNVGGKSDVASGAADGGASSAPSARCQCVIS